MNSPDELSMKVKGWLDQNRFPTLATITPATDLVAAGLLDSVRFLDLLLFLENETGKRFDFDAVDDFTTVGGLWRALQSTQTELSGGSVMSVAR